MARVYISGPMSGLPDFNYPAFHAAAKAWREAGWEVENPAELFGGATNRPYKLYAAHDVEVLQRCDAIAMLPGWDAPNARGSVWEREIARTLLNLPVYVAEAPISPPPTPLGFKTFIPVTASTTLPTDAAARKAVPLVAGVLDYFPDALVEIARVSKLGNDQHNPGQPIHWARGKSMDQADCIVRHLLDRGTLDSDGVRHSAKVAWRALALLQLELEAAGAPMARGAKPAIPETK